MTMTDEELVRVYRQAWDEAIALTKEQRRGLLASRSISHAAGLLAVATEAARRERERVARLFDEEAARCSSQAYAYEYGEMAARIRASGETSGTTPTPAQPPRAEDRFIRAYLGAEHGLRLGFHVRDAIARVVAAVRAEAPDRTAAAERADVAAYLRGLLPAGVDDLARFIERGDHVGAGKAKGVSRG